MRKVQVEGGLMKRKAGARRRVTLKTAEGYYLTLMSCIKLDEHDICKQAAVKLWAFAKAGCVESPERKRERRER